MQAPVPSNEPARLEALRQCGVMDSAPEETFDSITELAATLCDAPMAMISLVDADRQWFKSCFGTDVRQTTRRIAFCAHAILSEGPLVVPDATQDVRFADSDLVTGSPGVRFYAGVPLRTADGLALGSLCVVDTRPRTLSASQLRVLVALAAQVTASLDLRRRMQQLMLQGQENERLALAARRTACAVMLLDRDGRIEWANPAFARFNGSSGADAAGRTVCEALRNLARHPAPMEEIARGIARGVAASVDYRPDPADPETWHRLELEPMVDAEQRTIGFIATQRDVSRDRSIQAELRTAKEHAEEASRAKSEFLANMSHEIRTPMTAILGYADLMNEEQTAPSRRAECIETIKRNGAHLLAIINDILDLSKIESGKMTVESICASPSRIVAEVLGLLRINAQAKGLELEARYGSPVPQSIRTDPGRLRQILMNLVGNAIKFTDRGLISIQISYDADAAGGAQMRFEIVDTGVGLSQDQQARLFGAFTQADSSTTRRFGGSGLGLRISRHLARLLGGDITISSEPGFGSRFSLTIGAGHVPHGEFELPQNLRFPPQSGTTRHEPEHAAETAGDGGTPLRGLRILLVEDGRDNQKLITAFLTRAGATVAQAENGREAIEAMTEDGTVDGRLPAQQRFDAVLLDMQMPVMDGYTAAGMLKNKGCGTPLIALTAHAMSGDRDRCLAAGCDDYLAKPIDRKKLIECIGRWAGAATNPPSLALAA